MSDKQQKEQDRLAALKSLMVMDSPEELAYDNITRLAASVCDAPIALISLVDDKRQWFKARVGLTAKETPRDMAFCAHAIPHPDDVLVVQDAHADSRFAANPLVTGEPKIRFYAGAPLVTSGNEVMGTLCVIDRIPRNLLPEQLDTLKFMAAQVMLMLEKKKAASLKLAIERSNSPNLAKLRAAIAAERANQAKGSPTLQLLTNRMREYESGKGLAPSVSEFIEWRNLVELEQAKAHFAKARKAR